MRLALLILLSLSPLWAHADPVTDLIVLASFVFEVSETVVIMTAITAATTVMTVGVTLYGSAQARKAERAAKDAMNASLHDRIVTRIATDAPHRYVYGRARVGSDVVAMFTSGDKDQFRHLVCVHAAHECDAIEEIYIGGEALGPLDSSGNVTSGKYASGQTSDMLHESFTGPVFTLSLAPIDGTLTVYVPGSTGDYDGNGATPDIPVIPISVVGNVVTIAGALSVSVTYQIALVMTVTEVHTGPIFSLLRVPVDNSVTLALASGGVAITPISIVGSAITMRTADIVTATYQVAAGGTPRVRVHKHLGGVSDAADAALMAELPAGMWPATAVLRGFCYTVIRLDLNQSEFQGGMVSIQVLLRGRKLYDPRTGTTAWSTNPALAVYDYLTSPLCDVDPADLPLSQYITAANVCDDASVVAGGRYTINGAITSDEDQAKVLESMAQSMAGGIVATSWEIYAGNYVAPVAALLQGDIVGSVSITPGLSDATIYNGVKGQFVSLENDFVATDFKPFQNAAYLATDGRDLYTNIDFPFTNSLQRVVNLARIFIEDQRNGFTVKAEFSLKAWPLKIGQRITLTSAFIGQAAKVYRITDKRYSPNSAVELTLKEDAASIWDYADAVTPDSTPNTNLPDPWAVAPLASLACTSGDATLLIQADGTIVPRILVSWPAATTQSVFTNGEVDIEYRTFATDVWNKASVAGSATQAYLSPIAPGWFYAVRARCVNPYLNTKSSWVYTTHKAIGKTARPANVTGFVVMVRADGTRQFSFGTSNQAGDVVAGGGYRIAYRISGSGAAWIPLHAGLITQSPYESNNPPAGTYDFDIVAVDSSGNESLIPSVTAAVLGNEPVTYGAAMNTLANSDWQANTGGNTGIGSLYKWAMQWSLSSPPMNIGRNYQPWNVGRGGAWSQDSSNIGTSQYSELYQIVPVVAGQVYEYSVFVNPHRCQVAIFIYWFDAGGANLGNSYAGTYFSYAGPGNFAYGNGLKGYPFLWNTATAPAGAVTARLCLRKYATNSGSLDSYAFWDRVMMCIARPGVTYQTATPWIEAGIDNVHGGGIEALTVGTGQITANATTDLALLTSTGISIGKIGATYPTSNSQYTTLASYTFTPLVTGSVLVTFSSNNAYYSGGGMITYFDVPIARVYISGAVYNAADDVVPNSRTGDMIGGSSVGTANFFAKKILNVVAGVSTTIVFGMVARCQNSYSQVANDNNLHIEVIKK